MYTSRKFDHDCQNSLILSSDVQLECQDKPSVKWDEQKAKDITCYGGLSVQKRWLKSLLNVRWPPL